MPVVYETNRKYTYNFRGVRIPIFGSFPITLAMFFHESSQKFQHWTFCIDFMSEIETDFRDVQNPNDGSFAIVVDIC